MSYPTIPAYVAYAKAGEKLPNEHPVLEFLNDHSAAFDNGKMKAEPFTLYHTDDYTFTKSDGTISPPGEASWKAMLEGYAPFSEHFHDGRYACVYERNGAWEMVGIANVYGNLLVPGSEKTKTDSFGRKWDIVVPGSFLFTCVKDSAGPKGFKVKTMTLFGDGVPVVGEMIKRGMVKPEDLTK